MMHSLAMNPGTSNAIWAPQLDQPWIDVQSKSQLIAPTANRHKCIRQSDLRDCRNVRKPAKFEPQTRKQLPTWTTETWIDYVWKATNELATKTRSVGSLFPTAGRQIWGGLQGEQIRQGNRIANLFQRQQSAPPGNRNGSGLKGKP